MCCHGLFVIVGLYALFAGKFTLMRNRSVEGNRARAIGLVLILPTVITVCLTAANIDSGPSGSNIDQETATQIDGMSCILLIGALLVAGFLTMTAPTPAPVTYGAGLAMDGQQPYFAPGMLSGAPAGSPVPEQRILSLSEAAAYLQMSEADVLALIESGQIEAGRLGTQYRISKDSLDAYRDQSGGMF